MNSALSSLLFAFVSLLSDQVSVLAISHGLERFPDSSTCVYWINEGNKHIKWIDKRALLFPQDRYELWQYRQQVADYCGIWDKLRTCHEYRDTYVSIKYNRRRLEDIRSAIGEWNYRWGIMPPPIAIDLMWSVK